MRLSYIRLNFISVNVSQKMVTIISYLLDIGLRYGIGRTTG